METKTVLYGKNLEISERIKTNVTSKTDKFSKFLTNIEEVRIDLAHLKTARNANDRYVSQITIRGKGFILRTEERADELSAAFDKSFDKMIRQIERFKGKRGRTHLEKVFVDPAAPQAESEPVEETPVIARRKKFALIPMTEVEALEQMKLLGHEDFFVFYNGNTSAINVLYKRMDGTFGLIETEIA